MIGFIISFGVGHLFVHVNNGQFYVYSADILGEENLFL